MATLASLDLEGLRLFWRERFGVPPPNRSPDLLRYMLAWRLQAQALGGLDRMTARALRKPAPAAREGTQFGSGAILRRVWQGRTHEVIVTDNRFLWNGRSFKSLSAVAFAMTGTRWNGPRFFGLRGATP